MGLFYIFAITFLFLILLSDRQVLSFDVAKYTRFLKVIVLGAILALVARIIAGSFPPSPSYSISTILMVWSEDVLFSLLPIYYSRKYFPGHISTIITVLASLAFGASHLYISPVWAFVTCFYPFFFAYRVGEKHGYGTVMATHITYDLAIVAVQAALASMRNV